MQQEEFSRTSAQNREICRIPIISIGYNDDIVLLPHFKTERRRFLVTPLLGMTNTVNICHSETKPKNLPPVHLWNTAGSDRQDGDSDSPKRKSRGRTLCFFGQSLNSSSLQGGISSACAISSSASTLGIVAAVSIC